MSSWYDAWADRYDEGSAGVAADVPFHVALARQADGLLVELAVGTGRVAIPVARATGKRVVGIDSSPAMLAQARAGAVEAGVELDLREGDMRDLDLEEPAALIYCPGRSLLHLPTWADRRRCFERVAASLRPNGRFAWNAFAFDHAIAVECDLSQSRFPRISGRKANFSRSYFARSVFHSAVLDDADFTGTGLDECDFSRASLANVEFGGAWGARVRLAEVNAPGLRVSDGARFPGVYVVQATLPNSVWSGTELNQANFTFSVLERADFSSCEMRHATLSGCNLKAARFQNAKLVSATMHRSNVHEGVFELADLVGADLRGSNFHGAQFWRARIHRTRFDLAIVSATMFETGQ